MKLIKHILFALTIVSSINWGKCQTQCRDESGKVVDWYIVYKFPRVSKGASPIDTGLKYSYITSDSSSSWTLSSISVDSDKSIFGTTLRNVYDTRSNANLSYFFYNDEPPNADTDSTHAHAKGVLVSDDSYGYWLIHSVPHFASAEESLVYEYPSTGGRYGQIALCISFKITEINKIVDQLIYMEPKLYSTKVSTSFQKLAADATYLSNNNWTLNSGHDYNVNNLVSTGGQKFISFSKNKRAGVDLYSSIVGPTLKTALLVETWRKDPGTPLDSACQIAYDVENVASLKLKFVNSADSAEFSYVDDHSKWAIAAQSSAPYVCVGDINRMLSQYKRGGGTTCFESKLVWTALHDWIATTEKC